MIKSFLILLILLFALSCSSSSGPDNDDKLISDRPEAVNFTFSTISGDNFSLSDYTGKVVYLFFLGSYCPICIGNAPGTVIVDNKYDNSEVQVIGLDVWDGSGSQVVSFISSTGVKYPVLQNASSIQSDYGVRYDYSVLVDKQGRVAYKKEGVNSGELIENINSLLLE